MNKDQKGWIRRSLALAALVAAFALAGCTVTVGGQVLSAPTDVYATQGYYATTVSLTWDAVAGAGSYNYYYATAPSGSYQFLENTAAKSVSVYLPYSSASYYFKVAAVGSSGVEGALSSYATGWAYSPTAPTISATNGLAGHIYVTWNPVNDAVGYNVYDTTGTKYYLGKGVLDASGTYYFYFDNVSGTYYYQVESVYADNGISALSAKVVGSAY